jgi:alkylation response protein AidB-like acyl-CoA dehydrogenase
VLAEEEDELPIASTEEQFALQASIKDWAKRARSVEVVRSQETSAPGSAAEAAAERWSALAELGVFGIGRSPDGTDGTSGDLAAAVAALTEALVPGPVLPTLLARLVLSDGPDSGALRQILSGIAAGQVSVATAFDAGQVTGAWQGGGSLRLEGDAGLVLGGGSTTHLLVAAATDDGTRWCLLPSGQAGVALSPRAPADFSRSLAGLTLTGVTVSAEQLLGGMTTERVRDLAAALAAVEAAAVAGWCSRTAAEYAAIRHQFGRPIGSFQAVKHLCASMLCRAETAAVLAWDAARAMDEGPAELAPAAAAAAAFNLDAAVGVAKDCIQVLGGIGFTWEHDAHLYLRRALALRQLLGGSASWRDRAATLALAGHRRQLSLGEAGQLTRELAAVASAAGQLAGRVAGLPAAQRRRALTEAGYAAPAWPAPYGLGASPAELLVIDDELRRAGLARPDIVIGGWAIPAILQHGTAAQAERFAAATLRGEISWCQLFSEPEAGSDLASLRTRAERAEGGWLVTGQKVWTSLAREATWAICLARTDPAAPRHRGLTYFLVAMDSPGIDIRPLREMTGRQMFNEVFLDQVFVPDDCVVGSPGDGWRVTRTTLASERVAMGAGSSVGEAAEGLLALAQRTGNAADPVVRQQLGTVVAEGMAVSLLELQAVLAQLRGADPGPLAAVRKLVGVGHRQSAAEAALELAGPAASATDGDPAGLMHEFLLTRCLSIAGGTTQILLSLVAERLLGLPREETR